MGTDAEFNRSGSEAVRDAIPRVSTLEVSRAQDEAVALRHALRLLREACRVFDDVVSGLP